jgi:hypothetical protein
MMTATASTIASQIEQGAEEAYRRPAIRRIRQRHFLRETGTTRSPAQDAMGDRRAPAGRHAPRIHDRASMLLAAEVRTSSTAGERVVVRNISAAGLMVEMDDPPAWGAFVSLNLGGLGWTDGTVVWRIGKRFGVRFDEEIEPVNVRRKIEGVPQAYKPTPPRRIY